MNEERRRRPPPKITDGWLQRSALHYLRRYPATRGRLRTVMMRKIKRSLAFHGGEREEAEAKLDALIDRLAQAGAIDDARFVRARVEELHRRGTPERGIRFKLARQQAPRDEVDAALAELREREPDAELTAAVAYARRRRLGPFRVDEDERAERARKDLAAMARAGFGFAVARRVIEGDAADW
jgi:regulatory protein